MSAAIKLPIAALLRALAKLPPLRRILARSLAGRTRRWLVRVGGDGGLSCRGFALRLHGIAPAGDPDAIGRRLANALSSGPARLRVLGLDGDGALIVAIRCAGRGLAADLLRQGLAVVRGSGSRRLRAAQSRAQIERRGLWRWQQSGAPSGEDRLRPVPALAFPWWQG